MAYDVIIKETADWDLAVQRAEALNGSSWLYRNKKNRRISLLCQCDADVINLQFGIDSEELELFFNTDDFSTLNARWDDMRSWLEENVGPRGKAWFDRLKKDSENRWQTYSTVIFYFRNHRDAFYFKLACG